MVPLLTNFWTQRYDSSLAASICSDWRASVGLPESVVHSLQGISICQSDRAQGMHQADLRLLTSYVDVVYVTVHPHVAVQLATELSKLVIFRAFGHGSINTYSQVCDHHGVALDSLASLMNFVWCPILSTLQEPEDERICRNPQHLRAFVSPSRLGSAKWKGGESRSLVVDTIPRINSTDYYLGIYRRFTRDHGHLPLKILGGNEAGGGPIGDPRICGRLPHDEYYRTAAEARVCIYHGTSPYHLHYHVIEFMTLGLPVLFHCRSALAAEARAIGFDESDLECAGMYSDAATANRLAERALADATFAMGISERQRVFVDVVFSRSSALVQAQWLRTLAAQHRDRLRRAPMARVEANPLGSSKSWRSWIWPPRRGRR